MDRPDPSEPHPLLAAYRDLERMPVKRSEAAWLRLQAAIRAETAYTAPQILARPALADADARPELASVDSQHELDSDDSRHDLDTTDSRPVLASANSQPDPGAVDSQRDLDSAGSQRDPGVIDSPRLANSTDSQRDPGAIDSQRLSNSTDSQRDAGPAASPPVVLRPRPSRRAVWGAVLLAAAALALLFVGLRDLMTREHPATPDLAPHMAPADTDAQAPLIFAAHTSPSTSLSATSYTPPSVDPTQPAPLAATDTTTQIVAPDTATQIAAPDTATQIAAPDTTTQIAAPDPATQPAALDTATKPVLAGPDTATPAAAGASPSSAAALDAPPPPRRPRSDPAAQRRKPAPSGSDRPIADPLLDPAAAPDDPAPPPAADAPDPQGPGLDVELSLLRRARAALTAAAPKQALDLLAEHARRFPSGHLAEERMLLRVQALCAVGEPERARATARAFARAHPGSPHTPTIAAACRE